MTNNLLTLVKNFEEEVKTNTLKELEFSDDKKIKCGISLGKEIAKGYLTYRYGKLLLEATKKPYLFFALPFNIAKCYEEYKKYIQLKNKKISQKTTDKSKSQNQEKNKQNTISNKRDIGTLPKYKDIIISIKSLGINNVTPKVSVAIPVFNNFDFLSECIESVLGQTLKDIEVLIIDDGSTDPRTVKKIDEYATKDNRVIAIHKKNSGYGQSMNVALDYARGEYFGIVESDDYVDSQMFEKLYDVAKKNNLEVLKGDYAIFYGPKNNREFVNKDLMGRKNAYGKVTNSIKDVNIFNIHNVIWNGIYDLKFIRSNNIRFNETPGASFQDNGFWFQTFALAKRVMFDTGRYYMLRRDNPNSSVYSTKKIWAMADEYDFIFAFLKSNNELWNRLKYMYAKRRYQNLLFTYNRIDAKYRLPFLAYIYRELLNLKKANLIKQEVFSKSNWDSITNISNDYLKFHKNELYKQPLDVQGKSDIEILNYIENASQKMSLRSEEKLCITEPKRFFEKVLWLFLLTRDTYSRLFNNESQTNEWIARRLGVSNLTFARQIISSSTQKVNKIKTRITLSTAIEDTSEAFNALCYQGKIVYFKVRDKFDDNNQGYTYYNGDYIPICMTKDGYFQEQKPGTIHRLKLMTPICEAISRGINLLSIDIEFDKDEKCLIKSLGILDDETLYNLSLEAEAMLSKIINLDEFNYRKALENSKFHNEFDRPSVSVIIPVFNNEKYIEETIRAIQQQSDCDFELICVNDGSTDTSLEILRSYEAKDPRIKVIDTPHKGAGTARNIGLNIAQGEFLLFLDGDDLFEKDLIAKSVKRAKLTNADCCIFRADQFFEGSNKVEKLDIGFVKEFIPNKEVFSAEDFREHLFNTFQNWAWNKLFRKEFVIEHGIKFQEINKTNDFYFVAKAIFLAKRITTLDEVLVHYRKNTGCSTQDLNDHSPLDFLKAFDQVENFLIEKNADRKYFVSLLNHKIRGAIYNLRSLKTRAAFEILFKELKHRAVRDISYIRDSEIYYMDKYKQYKDISDLDMDSFIEKYKLQQIN